jgi:hypothetical protein
VLKYGAQEPIQAIENVVGRFTPIGVLTPYRWPNDEHYDDHDHDEPRPVDGRHRRYEDAYLPRQLRHYPRPGHMGAAATPIPDRIDFTSAS